MLGFWCGVRVMVHYTLKLFLVEPDSSGDDVADRLRQRTGRFTLQKNPAACSSARRSPASEPLKVQQGQRSRGLGKLEEHSVGSDFPIGIPARYDWVIVHS